MNYHYYIGNGAYCYANSTSMLLSGIGENVSPSLIEVLTGVGLGATLMKNKNLLYFNNQFLLPDLGLTKALDLLGFKYRTKVFDKPEDFPLDELRNDLKTSSAVIGPLDMSLLIYNPDHKNLKGADHFVLAYGIDEKFLYLHDPTGFPHVFIPLGRLKESWQAKGVSYKKGYYRYTFAPKRVESPSAKEMYRKALDFFKVLYRGGEVETDRSKFSIGREAINEFSKYIQDKGLNEKERGHLVYFALPLGAKRATDYSKFFEPFNKELSQLKYKQSQVFGFSHTYAAYEDWNSLVRTFKNLGEIEEQFKETLLSS